MPLWTTAPWSLPARRHWFLGRLATSGLSFTIIRHRFVTWRQQCPQFRHRGHRRQRSPLTESTQVAGIFTRSVLMRGNPYVFVAPANGPRSGKISALSPTRFEPECHNRDQQHGRYGIENLDWPCQRVNPGYNRALLGRHVVFPSCQVDLVALAIRKLTPVNQEKDQHYGYSSPSGHNVK